MKLQISIVLTLAFGLAHCSSETSDHQGTTPPTARRADPQPYFPPATEGIYQSGSTVGITASSVSDDVRQAALNVMRAWLDEDIEAIMAMLSDDFGPRQNTALSRQMLRDALRQQFSLLDFTQFSLEQAVDINSIEVIPYDPNDRSMSRNTALRAGDLFVRMRMLVTNRNGRRYFSDRTEMWFRRQAGQWRIVALGR